MASIKYDIWFRGETDQLRKDLSVIRREVDKVYESGRKELQLNKDLAAGVEQARLLEAALQRATTEKGTAWITLNNSLKAANTSAAQMAATFSSAGMTKSLGVFLETFSQADRKLISISNRFQELHRVLFQSIRYSVALDLQRFVLQQVEGSITWVRRLSEELTNISIVSGKTGADVLKTFDDIIAGSKKLRVAAQEFAQAALIFYQQGLPDEEVQRRTEITIKTARAAGTAMEEMSEYLTAIWNTYQMPIDQLERTASIAAKLGAETAVDLEYIATAMQSSASAASQMGVQYESLASIIATVGSVTLQSAQVIGNAYKTIFARFQNLAPGEEGEGDLGRIAAGLQKFGINVIDTTDELRALDSIIMQTGLSWETYSQKQQVAIAQIVGGIRQYPQFLALMNNFDAYLTNMYSATAEEGGETLARQYAESLNKIDTYITKSTESWRRAFGNVFRDESQKTFYRGLTQIGEVVENITHTVGGLPGILLYVSGIFSKDLAPKVQQVFEISKDLINNLTPERSIAHIGQQYGEMRAAARATFAEKYDTETLKHATGPQALDMDDAPEIAADLAKIDLAERLAKKQVELNQLYKNSNAEKKIQVKMMQDELNLAFERFNVTASEMNTQGKFLESSAADMEIMERDSVAVGAELLRYVAKIQKAAQMGTEASGEMIEKLRAQFSGLQSDLEALIEEDSLHFQAQEILEAFMEPSTGGAAYVEGLVSTIQRELGQLRLDDTAFDESVGNIFGRDKERIKDLEQAFRHLREEIIKNDAAHRDLQIRTKEAGKEQKKIVSSLQLSSGSIMAITGSLLMMTSSINMASNMAAEGSVSLSGLLTIALTGIPAIISLSKALQGLGIAASMGLGPLGLIIAGISAGIVVINNLHKRAEAERQREIEQLRDSVAAHKELRDELIELKKELSDLSNKYKDGTISIEEYSDAILELENRIVELRTAGHDVPVDLDFTNLDRAEEQINQYLRDETVRRRAVITKIESELAKKNAPSATIYTKTPLGNEAAETETRAFEHGIRQVLMTSGFGGKASAREKALDTVLKDLDLPQMAPGIYNIFDLAEKSDLIISRLNEIDPDVAENWQDMMNKYVDGWESYLEISEEVREVEAIETYEAFIDALNKPLPQIAAEQERFASATSINTQYDLNTLLEKLSAEEVEIQHLRAKQDLLDGLLATQKDLSKTELESEQAVARQEEIDMLQEELKLRSDFIESYEAAAKTYQQIRAQAAKAGDDEGRDMLERLLSYEALESKLQVEGIQQLREEGKLEEARMIALAAFKAGRQDLIGLTDAHIFRLKQEGMALSTVVELIGEFSPDAAYATQKEQLEGLNEAIRNLNNQAKELKVGDHILIGIDEDWSGDIAELGKEFLMLSQAEKEAELASIEFEIAVKQSEITQRQLNEAVEKQIGLVQSLSESQLGHAEKIIDFLRTFKGEASELAAALAAMGITDPEMLRFAQQYYEQAQLIIDAEQDATAAYLEKQRAFEAAYRAQIHAADDLISKLSDVASVIDNIKSGEIEKVGEMLRFTATQAADLAEIFPEVVAQMVDGSNGMLEISQANFDQYIALARARVEQEAQAAKAIMTMRLEELELEGELEQLKIEILINGLETGQTLAELDAQIKNDIRVQDLQKEIDKKKEEIDEAQKAAEIEVDAYGQISKAGAEAAENNADNAGKAAEVAVKNVNKSTTVIGRAIAKVIEWSAKAAKQYSKIGTDDTSIEKITSFTPVAMKRETFNAQMSTFDFEYKEREVSESAWSALNKEQQSKYSGKSDYEAQMSAIRGAIIAGYKNIEAINKMKGAIIAARAKIDQAMHQAVVGTGAADKAGKSGSAERLKELELLEEILTNYQLLELQLERVRRAYTRLNAVSYIGHAEVSRLSAIVKLREKEADLLERLAVVRSEQLRMQGASITGALGDRTISNEEVLLNQYAKAAETANKKYNDYVNTHKQANKSQQEAAEKLKKEADAAKKDYEELISLFKEFYDAEEEITKLRREMRQQELNAMTAFIDQVLSLQNKLGTYADHFYSQMVKGSAAVLAATNALTRGADNMEARWTNRVAQITNYQKLSEYAMSGISRITSGKQKNDPWEDWEIEKYEQYVAQIMDTNESLFALNEEMLSEIGEVFGSWAEQLDRVAAKFDRNLSQLDSMKNILELAGPIWNYGANEKKYAIEIEKAAMGTLRSQLAAAKVRKESIEVQRAAMQEEVNALKRIEPALSDATAHNEWQRQMQSLVEDLHMIEDAAADAAESFYSSYANAMQKAHDIFIAQVENSILSIKQIVSQDFYGDWDFMKDSIGYSREVEDRYENAAQASLELNQLMRDINDFDTSQIQIQTGMDNLLDDIMKKKESGARLTRYELEVLQDRFKLLKAQAEWEDARAAKTSMRLARDASGNWTYVYSADEEQVDSKAKEIEETYNRIWQNSYKREQEALDGIISAWDQYYADMAALDKNDESYNEKVLVIRNRLYERLEWYLGQYNLAVENSGKIHNDVVLSEISDLQYIQDIRDIGAAKLDHIIGQEAANLLLSQEGHKKLREVVDEETRRIMAAHDEMLENLKDIISEAGDNLNTLGRDYADFSQEVARQSERASQEIQQLMYEAERAVNSSIEKVGEWSRAWTEEVSKIIAANNKAIQSFMDLLASQSGFSVDESGNLINDFNLQTDYADQIVKAWSARTEGLTNFAEFAESDAAIRDLLDQRARKLGYESYKQFINNDVLVRQLEYFAQMGISPQSEAGKGIYVTRDQAKNIMNIPEAFINSIIQDGRIYLSKLGEYLPQFGTGAYVKMPTVAVVGESGAELVLKPEDTQNILNAVTQMRDIVRLKTNSVLGSRIARTQGVLSGASKDITELEQRVAIEASFPNVRVAGEIEEAFNNLINLAAQYAIN